MTNSRPADDLRSYRDRIVRLEQEKKQIAQDIKDVLAEAQGRGYDTKALRVLIKRSMETEEERHSRVTTELIAELYLASLGMLDGTPLGEAARKRAAQQPPDEPPSEPEGDGGQQGGLIPDDFPPVPSADLGPEQIEAARDQGRQDAQAGKRIIQNPFTAGDPRRAAWDEGHCEASGSDGMDIPAAWRRPPKPKRKGASSPEGEG